MQRTLYQVINQYDRYFSQLEPNISTQRAANELRIQQLRSDVVIRRSGATPNRTQGRLR